MKKKFYFLILLSVLAGVASCEKEVDLNVPEKIEKAGIGFSLHLDEPGSPETKSLLTSTDIETKVTSVTLAAYQNGALVDKGYYTGSQLSGMPLTELADGVFDIYALVNMGDLTSVVPATKAAMDDYTYTITTYAAIDQAGIPMAGTRQYAVGDPDTVIPVKRLMAKVTADLSVKWPGVITEVKVGNMNKNLKPFGKSVTSSTADILGEEEYSVGGNVTDGEFTFYVPENRHGLLGPGTVSEAKMPGGDPAITEKKDYLTYLETTVAGSVPSIEGQMTYRSYLGKNELNDFDIERNCRYSWRIEFGLTGITANDWKHENNLSWSMYRFSLNAQEIRVYSPQNSTLTVQVREDHWTNGVKDKNNWNVYTPPSYLTYNWSWHSPDNLYVNDDNIISNPSYGLNNRTMQFWVSGGGTRIVDVDCNDGIATTKLSATVYAYDFERLIEIRSANGQLSAAPGDLIKIQYRLGYKNNSGVISWNAWQDFTDAMYGNPVLQLGTLGSGGTGTINANGTVTWSTDSECTVNAFWVTPESIGVYSDMLRLSFDSSHASYIGIEPASFSGTVNEVYSPKVYYYTWNGSSYTKTDVTSSAEFSGYPAGLSISGNSITSSTPGSFTITAAYSGINGEATATWAAAPVVTTYLRIVPNGMSSVTDIEPSTPIALKAQYSTDNVNWTDASTATWSFDSRSSTDIKFGVNSDTATGAAVSVRSGGSDGNATVKAEYNGKTTSIPISWKTPEAPHTYSFRLDPKNSEAKAGNTVNIKAYFTDNGVDTDVTSSATWTKTSTIGTVGKGTVSSTEEGTVTLTVTYTYGGHTYSDNAEVVFTKDHTYSIRIDPNTNVKGYPGKETILKAYYSVDGVETEVTDVATWTILSGQGDISKGKLVPKANVGAQTIVVKVEYGDGDNKRSTVVSIRVYDVSFSWNGGATPAYVGHRGLLVASGNPEGTTIAFSVLEGSSNIQLSGTDSDRRYVNLIHSGNSTVKVAFMDGGTEVYSKTYAVAVTAPVLAFGAGKYYGNPDGSEVRTGVSGLDGNTLSVGYTNTGGTAMTRKVATATEVVTGNYFASDLYDTYLEPVLTADGSYLGVQGGKVCVVSLGGGSYPHAAGSAGGTTVLGNVKANAKASTGVTEKSVNVYDVNPFKSTKFSSPVNIGRLDDYTPIKDYYTFSGTKDLTSSAPTTAEMQGTPATLETHLNGFPVNVNQGSFSYTVSSGMLQWNIDTHKAQTLHKGGQLSFHAKVTNSWSGESISAEFGKGELFVHGAFGPKVVRAGNTYQVFASYVGTTGSLDDYIAGQLGGINNIIVLKPGILSWTITSVGMTGTYIYTVNASPASGYGINSLIYTFTLTCQPAGGPTLEANELRNRMEPNVVFQTPSNSAGISTYAAYDDTDNILYLHDGTSYTWNNYNVGKKVGYYVIHLIGDIANYGEYYPRQWVE